MDFRLCDWARSQGVRTAVHSNAEFYRHGQHNLPHPDAWWLPTAWRLGAMPPGTRVVPVPAEPERFDPDMARPDRPRFLHPVGKWAYGDRNGTETVVRACHLLRRGGHDLDVTITCLHPLPHECAPGGDWVDVRIGGAEHWWEAYDGYHVLLMPRRWGGLSLPAIEAAAAGMAVVMADVEPNPQSWPIEPVPATIAGKLPVPAGHVDIAEVRPEQLAEVMRRLASSPRDLAEARDRSRQWATEHSWERLAPLYWEELARAITDPFIPPPPRHDPFAARPSQPRQRAGPPGEQQDVAPRRQPVPPPPPSPRRPRVGT